VITASTLRLDLEHDQKRLKAVQITSALTPVSSRNSAPRYHQQYGVWKLSLRHKPDFFILIHTKRNFLSTNRRRSEF
jgi:hypothetical protein